MSKMCHACGSEEITMDEVNIMDPTCSTSCCKMCNPGEGSSIVTGEINWFPMDSSPCSTPYGTPVFSRENSFSSFASCFSSLGGSLTDSDFEEEIELQDTGQLNPDTLNDLMENGEGSFIQVEECRLTDIAGVDDGATFPIQEDQNISSGHPQLQTLEDSTKEKIDATNIASYSNLSSEQHQDILSNSQFIETKCGVSVENIDLEQSTVIDVEEVTSLPMPGGDIVPLNEQVMGQLDTAMENTIVYNDISNTEPDMKHGTDFDNENECLYPLVLPSFYADPHIWLPPAPENKEDDLDTVFNNYDESENNSTGWARSTLDINLSDRSKESHEDQLQKVMSEVMNGQFKILVSRFLAAEGFSLSDGGTDKNWLDIVASLSWDAALLVKPDANSGNAMDPGLYVKVKCIASGSCQQSEVINGLVFKKSAAHKQMRANVKHPKLLLLQGALGHSSTGLASINSMKQKYSCSSCGQSPEAHMYSYTHHNGTLTVLVKMLPLESSLSGKAQGKLWMWTRCLRCNAKPTHRVIISSSARNLSFGKFLELSFSTHSAAKKLSTCGHLLHRDCLRFFGFGSIVAMFIYSSVEIYSACKPPLTLEFNNRNKKDWLDLEVNNVLLKWKHLFTVIENGIQDLRTKYSTQAMREDIYERLFLEVTRMLKKEQYEVEVSLKAFNQVAIPESFAHEILGLNWLYQQLLLGFYIWDLRLLHILQYTKVNTALSDKSIQGSTGSISIQDAPSVKNIGMERNEATISSSSSFEDKAQLTDKLLIKEHELLIYQDNDNMNVMDYSLFVGVDKQKKELVFGIIDYLRQYTWDKQLESWVKTSLFVPKNLSPTVISPREYKTRFRAFMSQHFLSVPDA
nr:unnamed protein product [Digitaria exilis]